jgi:hypothetical protein
VPEAAMAIDMAIATATPPTMEIKEKWGGGKWVVIK